MPDAERGLPEEFRALGVAWRLTHIDVTGPQDYDGGDMRPAVRRREGYLAASAPGLAIAKLNGPWWSVTHLHSGLAVGGFWKDRRAAGRLAVRLARVGDWTRSGADLRADRSFVAAVGEVFKANPSDKPPDYTTMKTDQLEKVMGDGRAALAARPAGGDGVGRG